MADNVQLQSSFRKVETYDDRKKLEQLRRIELLRLAEANGVSCSEDDTKDRIIERLKFAGWDLNESAGSFFNRARMASDMDEAPDGTRGEGLAKYRHLKDLARSMGITPQRGDNQEALFRKVMEAGLRTGMLTVPEDEPPKAQITSTKVVPGAHSAPD